MYNCDATEGMFLRMDFLSEKKNLEFKYNKVARFLSKSVVTWRSHWIAKHVSNSSLFPGFNKHLRFSSDYYI